MHHEPYRATAKRSAPEGVYLSENVRHDDGSVVTYTVPANVTEAEWSTYPAAIKKLVRDKGLHDVKSDDEYRAARTAYEATDAEGNPKAPAAEKPKSEVNAADAPAPKSRGAAAKEQQPMSAGDLYFTELRAAKEVTPGTAITTMTRRLYLDEVTFSPNVDAEPIRAQTGTRTNVVGIRKGPFQVTGNFTTGIAPGELIELFDLAMNGTPTVTTPMGGTLTRDRVYLPGTLASATFEYNDAALISRIAGTRVNSWTIDVDPTGDATMSGELFASNHVTIGAPTGTVTQGTPNYLSGWQGTWEMAPFGSGTYTTFNDLVMGVSFTMNNNLDRVYTLRNSQAAKRVSVGLMDATATVTFDAADAQAAAELINWRTDVKKVLRLTMQAATVIEGTLYESLIIEIPGAWTAPDLAGTTQNVRSYSFPLQYVLDNNLGGGIKVTVRSNRPASGANAPWLDRA